MVASKRFSFFGRRKSRDSLGEESGSNHKRRGLRTRMSWVVSISVYFDGREVGCISIKPNQMIANIRTMLLADIPHLAQYEFYFLYSKDIAEEVDLEDENITRITCCLDDTNNLCIATKEFMQQNEDISDILLTDEELRDISPEAEGIIRCCFRLLENAVFVQAAGNSSATLPKLARNCVRFIKHVARATVDSRATHDHPGSPNIKWHIVEPLLYEIELHVVLSNSRQQFAEWWFYRKDQKVLMDIIGSIQQEFRQSPNLRSGHPVFCFKLQKANAETESLVDVLNKVKLLNFAGKKFDSDREKLARFLGVKEEQLRFEILTKKDGFLLGTTEENPLFNRRVDGGQVDELPTDRMSLAQLKATLAPLLDLQDAFIDEDVKEFCPGTREWALGAFDEWICDHHTSNRSFILTGPAGSGKTCFASKLVRTRSDHILAYHFCRHDDNRFRDPKVMLLSLIYQLSLQSPHFDRCIRRILAQKGLTRKQLLRAKCSIQMIFADLLASPLSEIQVPATDRFVIVIDGIDESNGGVEGCNEILDTIQGMFHRLPGWVLFCFTTKPRLPVLKKLRKFNARMIAPTGDQNDIDFKRFFEASFSRCDARDQRFSTDLPNMLAFNAGESFFFCKIVVAKLKDCQVKNQFEQYSMLKLEHILRKECSAICADHIELFWEVVKLCMVAIKPLELEVLRDLLGCEVESLLRLFAKSKSFFANKASIIHFVHKVSKDWLLSALFNPQSVKSLRESRASISGSSLKNQPQREASDEISSCHSFFATQVRRLMIGEDGASKDATGKTRAFLFRHGVHHLVLGNMLTEAKELILNPAWLLSHSADLDDIAESCELLSKGDQMLTLLARAVSLSGEATRNDPRQLIGQLVGRLIAVTGDGHSDDSVRERMVKFLHDLRSHEYGFRWWCPVGPTWDQAEQPYLRTMAGHSDSIQSAAWHCDGRRCASGSWDGDIRVWDTLTGHCSHTLSGHTSTVWTIDWEPSGSRLASGSLDNSVRIWNTDTNSCDTVLEGHEDCVWSVRWSHDAKAIASGSKDKTIIIWDVSTGSCLKILSGSEGLIYSIAWEGDMNSRICSGSTDNYVRIWSTQNATCVAKLKGHRDWVRSVDWCKTGRHIVSASADQTVRVWDAETFECEHVLMGHSDTVWSVSMSTDGRYAVSGSSDWTVRVWNCDTGRAEQVLKGHKGAVWTVAFGPDSKRVVSGSADKSLVVWDASVGVQRETISGHLQPIWCIDVSRDGSKILSGSADKTARLWNATSGLCEKVFSGHTGPVFGIKLSMDGKCLATASSDNTAAVYRINTGDRKLQLVGHTGAVWCVAWSANDSHVFTGSEDMTIRAWNANTGKCKSVFEGHTKDVKGISISLDGRRLASASTDTTIRVWNLATYSCESVLSRQEASCLCVDWHPQNNHHLAAGYASGSVCVWNTDTGERDIDFLPGHARRTNAVSWSPDGQNIVSASSDKEIRFWNMDGHQCEQKIRASTVGIFDVMWTGRFVVSCGADKSIRLFNPGNGRCEAVLAGENRNSLGILDMALSKDGKYAVSGSRQRIVQIWNAESGMCEKTFSGHTNWVHSVFFDESGKRVLSRSDDGTTRLWDVESGECLMVNEDSDMMPEGFVAGSKRAPRRLSSIGAQHGQPVSVLCDKVRAEEDKACGWIGKQVYFFQLMGKKQGSTSLGKKTSSE